MNGKGGRNRSEPFVNEQLIRKKKEKRNKLKESYSTGSNK
jgi:stalled ribosome alternative rescue factor ArfA